jgi:carboxypeptidase T
MEVIRRIYKLSLIVSAFLMITASNPSMSADAKVAAEITDSLVVVRVYYENLEDINLLSRFDVFEYNNVEERYVLVLVDQAEIVELENLGFRVEIDVEQTANMNLAVVLDETQSEGIPGYPCYRTVEETYATAQEIVNIYPNLASWIDVGDSWEKSVGQADGYDMMVLKLTNSAISGPKPVLFVTASIHAREYTPAELTTRFAEYLINNYNIDADATWLLDQHEIHLMLQANPDGRKEAETGASWRKNTNENYCGATSSNRGADLNRNFSYMWGGSGSSEYPCDTTYRGPSAASEPETQAIQDYLKAIFPDQRDTGAAPTDTTGVYLDLHSYSNLVIWPWGYTSTLPPNSSGLQTLGRKFAYFNGYTPQQAYQLYQTSGTTDDYSYGELGIASYTFELGTTFFQSCTYFENTILQDNLEALIYAAKVARTPYMTPLGPDALNLVVTPTSGNVSDPVSLTATIDDTRYRSRTGEPTQSITAAEYYIDIPPWQTGAVTYSMTPADGNFNSKVENVTASVDTTGLSEGRHMLFVRGQDADGNWGAFSAIFFNLEPTAVELLSFQATVEGSAIRLTWETASEIDTMGFNLYRSEAFYGERTMLNPVVIPSQVYPGSPTGASYSYLDTGVSTNTNYFYWLEEVDIYGRIETHALEMAVMLMQSDRQQILLPIILRVP